MKRKIEKLDQLRFLIEDAVQIGVSDALLEEIYKVFHGDGFNPAEIKERVIALEKKFDTMYEKLDAVARRLG